MIITIISRLQGIKLIPFLGLCFLYSTIFNAWANDQVDLMAEDPILVYKISHHTLSEDDGLKIQVYNDGYVLLHYPVYMKKAGDYSVQLSEDDLRRLIDALEAPSVTNFDNRIIEQQIKAEDEANSVVTYVSDTSYSSFEVSRSDESGGHKTKQKISCPNLQYDAKHHPNIRAINKLAAVELILSSLMDEAEVQELTND